LGSSLNHTRTGTVNPALFDEGWRGKHVAQGPGFAAADIEEVVAEGMIEEILLQRKQYRKKIIVCQKESRNGIPSVACGIGYTCGVATFVSSRSDQMVGH